MQPGNLALLGSTGSIGTQTLDIVRRNPGQFRVISLSARASCELLISQAKEFRPQYVAIAEQAAFTEVKRALEGVCRVECGEVAVCNAAALPDVHTAVAGMVGFACLKPVVAAIKAGKHIAQANKEVLVAAGPLIKKLIAQHKIGIAPLDSEHNALFQCMLGRGLSGLRRVILTASGGPFFKLQREEMERVTPEEAIRHPRWNMGPKISIDSASLMNKGLEVIEAAMLFDLSADAIEVLIHPQSIVHGLVEYREGSTVAIMYEPDMRVAIGFALAYLRSSDPVKAPGTVPVESGANFLDLSHPLEFFRPDLNQFPGLQLCYRALRAGGTMPAVLNAANEVAVTAFVEGKCGFMGMSGLVAAVMELHQAQPIATIEEVIAADAWARQAASNILAS